MKKDNHILFLVPGFPLNQKDSWVVTYFANYIKAIKNSNPELQFSIVTLEYPYVGKEYSWQSVPVYSVVKSRRKIYKPLKWIKAVNQVKHINQKAKITLIHSLWLRECALLAQYLGIRIKAKVICTVMGTELRTPNPYLRWINFRNIQLIAVSEFMHSHIREELNVESVIIPWGIPIKNDDLGLKEKRTIDLLFVGFLNELKNLDLFLRIVRVVKKSIPTINAVVIGEEYKPNYVQKMVSFQKLNSEVEYVGRLNNRDVLNYMHKTRLLIHTADFESQGYVLLEALSCGMNIISKEVGIAKKSPKWNLADSIDDFANQAINILSTSLDHEPFIPYLMSDTIKGYKKLYESN